jgi:hypothetical protein
MRIKLVCLNLNRQPIGVTAGSSESQPSTEQPARKIKQLQPKGCTAVYVHNSTMFVRFMKCM